MVESTRERPPSWEDWYDEKEVSDKRTKLVQEIHRKFLATILDLDPSLAIEAGVGTGNLGHSLREQAGQREQKLAVLGIDLSEGLLRGSKAANGNNVGYVRADTFKLPFAEEGETARVVFHQGLLEHFEDDEVRDMLHEQLRVAEAVVASVPSDQYEFKQGLRGDERLLSPDEWVSVISGEGSGLKAGAFYYGMNEGEEYHVCLVVTASVSNYLAN